MPLVMVARTDGVGGMVDALASIKWKKLQDATLHLAEHGIMVSTDDARALQARAYFRKDIFRDYVWTGTSRVKVAIGLATLVDCLSTFARASSASTPLKTLTLENAIMDYAIADGPDDPPPVSFAVKSTALRDAIDDLEWPGSSITMTVRPHPPSVAFCGQGHGELQIDFNYTSDSDLFIAFNCNREVSYTYKYKHLRATVASIPSAALKENRGSKLTIDCHGLLKVQHMIAARKPAHVTEEDQAAHEASSRISYVEFFVLPEEDQYDPEDEM
eukprot:jgi/Chlat1/7469/Chrsp6S07502